MRNTEVTLSPSSLNYEDRRCDRCFGEALNGESWPDRPFPGIFSKLDSYQTRYFTGRPTSDVDSSLPPGTLHNGTRVRSVPLTVDGVDFVIRGSMDALIRFDDGTVGIVDYKSSTAQPGLIDAYRPQLAAYQWAVSSPETGDPETVSATGLFVFSPESLVDTDHGRAYQVSSTWLPVEIGDDWFEAFLKRLVPLVEAPGDVPSSSGCEWCDIRVRLNGRMRRTLGRRP